MLPTDISDYKRGWMMANYFKVTVHSDFRRESIEWCKGNLPQHVWDIKRFTDVYQDTIRFELEKDLLAFMSNADFKVWR